MNHRIREPSDSFEYKGHERSYDCLCRTHYHLHSIQGN